MGIMTIEVINYMAKKKNKNKNGNKKPVKKQQKKEGIEQKSIPDGIHEYIIIPMLLMIHLIKQEVCDIIGLLKGVKPKQGLQIGCIASLFMFFTLASWAVDFFFYRDYRQYGIERSGIQTTAVVVKTAEREYWVRRRTRTFHYAIYEYTIGDTEYRKEVGNRRGLFHRNDTIAIKYLPESPVESYPIVYMGHTPRWIRGVYELFN